MTVRSNLHISMQLLGPVNQQEMFEFNLPKQISAQLRGQICLCRKWSIGPLMQTLALKQGPAAKAGSMLTPTHPPRPVSSGTGFPFARGFVLGILAVLFLICHSANGALTAPDNDLFSQAQMLPGARGQVTGTTV